MQSEAGKGRIEVEGSKEKYPESRNEGRKMKKK